jgi:hypothetical protein
MEILHRGHIGTEHKQFLEAEGIYHKPWFSVRDPAKIRDYIFEIGEDNPAFAKLISRLTKKHTTISTVFTDQERFAAEWCIIRGEYSIEALRPEGYGWHEQYYVDQCPTCGIGWRQVRPFRIKKEPELKRHAFCSFGSGFELVCTPTVLEGFARQRVTGFDIGPIILDGSEAACSKTKQILVKEIAGPAIAEEFVERERYNQTDCSVCGNTWHAYYVRGMLPLRRSALNPHIDFQLTNEWFGNGANARREILISQKVTRLILSNQWRGAQLVPIKLV